MSSKQAELVEVEPPPASMLAVIERASRSPEVDVEKMRALLDMQKEILSHQAEMAFNADFAAMQSDLPVIAKNGEIKVNGVVRSKYALFEDMNELVKPILQQHGFAVLYKTGSQKGEVTVSGTLMHREGHRETTELTLEADTSGSKNSVQSIGSSLQYAKRYILASLLNLTTAGEDDDGKRGAIEYVSETQQADLKAMLDKIETKDNPGHAEKVFLTYFKIEKIADLPASEYQRAVKAIEKKRAAA